MVEVEQRRGRGAALGGRAAAVLLDRRLLQLGVALEAERLREADDGRRGGVGAAGELLGGLEGGLVEVVDDVAGDVLLRARELVEALGDVGGERLAVGPHRRPGARWSRRPSAARGAGRDLVAVLLTAGCFASPGAFPFRPAALQSRSASAAGVIDVSPVDLEQALRLHNRFMIGFDLALGSGALLAPDQTLLVLGHDEPSPDARDLFRRCGPILKQYGLVVIVFLLRYSVLLDRMTEAPGLAIFHRAT